MRHLYSLSLEGFNDRYEALFCDADGTLRRCIVPGQPTPNAEEEWEPIAESAKWLANFKWGEKYFAIVSNQGGVARGYLSADTAINLLVSLLKRLSGDRLHFRTRVDAAIGGNEDPDRKPNTGMLIKISKQWSLEPSQILMVGDLESDRQCAANFGCDFIWAWDLFGFPDPRSPRTDELAVFQVQQEIAPISLDGALRQEIGPALAKQIIDRGKEAIGAYANLPEADLQK